MQRQQDGIRKYNQVPKHFSDLSTVIFLVKFSKKSSRYTILIIVLFALLAFCYLIKGRLTLSLRDPATQ